MNSKNKDNRPRTILEQARVSNAAREAETQQGDETEQSETQTQSSQMTRPQSEALTSERKLGQNQNIVPSQPQVIIQKEKKSFNLMGCLGWIRNLGCLLILLVCCGSIFILVSKPQGIWNGIVTFLNDGYVPPTHSTQLDVNAIQNQINGQLQTIGEQTILVSEDQLSALISSKVNQFPNLSADIEANEIILSWDLDKTVQENPLKGIMILGADTTGKIVVKHVGVKRVNMPEFITQFMTDQFYKLASNLTDKNSQFGILQNIIPSNGITIKSIQMEEDQLKITIDVKVDLFNQ